MLCCDPVDRGAIATAVVRKVQQRADPLDRKAKIARAANERQSRKMVLAIVAIIRFYSRRRGQQASLFIIADRFNLRGRRPTQFHALPQPPLLFLSTRYNIGKTPFRAKVFQYV